VSTRLPAPSACLASAMLACTLSPRASAAVSTYGTYEEWIENADDVQEMTFADTDLPSGTFLTDQLAHTGITFRQDDWIQLANLDVGFPDMWFIQNFNADRTMWIDFAHPITAVGLDTLVSNSYQLWLDDMLVADIPETIVSFNGFISETPFNAIRIRGEGGQYLAVDTVYHGVAIPGPPVLGVLSMASIVGVAVNHRRR